MNKFAFIGLLLIAFASSLIGQEQFDRYYRTLNRDMIALDMQTSNGNYFLLSHFVETNLTDTTGTQGINITKLLPKGDLDWSRDYVFEDTLATFFSGQIFRDMNGNIFFNASLDDDENTDNRVLVKTDGSGNPLWSRRYLGQNSSDISHGNVHGQDLFNGTIVQTGLILNASEVGSVISRIDSIGDIMWSNRYQLQDSMMVDLNEFNGDLLVTVDTTILTVGTLDSMTVKSDIYLHNLDTLGNTIWSKSYSAIGDQNINLKGTDVAQCPDSTFIVSGIFEDTNNSITNGIVMKVDTIGDLLWARRISLGANFSVRAWMRHIVATADGGAIISGSSQEVATTELQDIVIRLDANGEAVWQNRFPQLETEIQDIGNLVSTDDGGSAYFNNRIDPNISQPTFINRLIKMDELGTTRCEDTLAFDIVFDLNLNQDTAIWAQTPMDSTREVLVADFSYNGFDLPILTLMDTMFCPGDPVMFELDATVEGATMYEWTTADEPDQILSTDSIFIATEIDVDYIATVFVEDELCFTLCDTTRLTEIPLPTVNIGFGNSNFCNNPNNRVFDLFAQATGDIVNIAWSTGEMTPNIQVVNLGSYSVTVTSDCGDTASASITITEANIPQPDPINVNANLDDICNGFITLTANGNQLTNLLWSTGETTTSIQVTEDGSYSVTGLDFCLRETQGGITIVEDDFYQVGEIRSLELGDCSIGSIPLFVQIEGDVNDTGFEWSTGETGTNSIIVSDPGTYTVTVTDICGAELNESITVTCEQCLQQAQIDDLVLQSCDINGSAVTFAIQSQGDIQLVELVENGNVISSLSNPSGNFTITSPQRGDFILRVTDLCGGVEEIGGLNANCEDCFDEAQIEGTSLTECNDDLVEFTIASSGDILVAELLFDGEVVDALQNPTGTFTLEGLMRGNYELRLTGACEDIDERDLEATCTPEGALGVCIDGTATSNGLMDSNGRNTIGCLCFPNVFLPSNTGSTPELLNEKTFGPVDECGQVDEYIFRIFNRWGQMVFETDEVGQKWDGMHNNEPAPAEAYAFYAEYTFSGEVFNYRGNVTLIR